MITFLVHPVLYMFEYWQNSNGFNSYGDERPDLTTTKNINVILPLKL